MMSISTVKRLLKSNGTLQLNFNHYVNRKMIGYIGETLTVQYDTEDDSKVRVFDEKDQLICVARKVEKKPHNWGIHCMGFNPAKPNGGRSILVKVTDLPNFIVHKGNAENPQSKGRSERILGAITHETNKRLHAYGVPQFINDPDFNSVLASMEKLLDKKILQAQHSVAFAESKSWGFPCHPSKTKVFAEERLKEAQEKNLKAKQARLDEKLKELQEAKAVSPCGKRVTEADELAIPNSPEQSHHQINQDIGWLFNECEERYNILKDVLDDIRQGKGEYLDTQLAISDMKGALELLDQHVYVETL